MWKSYGLILIEQKNQVGWAGNASHALSYLFIRQNQSLISPRQESTSYCGTTLIASPCPDPKVSVAYEQLSCHSGR